MVGSVPSKGTSVTANASGRNGVGGVTVNNSVLTSSGPIKDAALDASNAWADRSASPERGDLRTGSAACRGSSSLKEWPLQGASKPGGARNISVQWWPLAGSMDLACASPSKKLFHCTSESVGDGTPLFHAESLSDDPVLVRTATGPSRGVAA